MKLLSNFIANITTEYKRKAITNVQIIVTSRSKPELRTQLIITSVTQKYTSLARHNPTSKAQNTANQRNSTTALQSTLRLTYVSTLGLSIKTYT